MAVVAELVPGGRAALVDINAGGTCVGTLAPLQVGTVCDLHFGAGNGDLPLRASVVWSVPQAPGRRPSVPLPLRAALRGGRLSGR